MTGTILNPGHTNRLVQQVSVGGRDLIRKQYHDDAGETIHRAMADLWASPFGASRQKRPGLPEPLAYDRIGRTLDMEVLTGPPLGVRGSVGQLPCQLDQLAALLADLHESGVVVARRRDARKLQRSILRKLGPARPTLLTMIARVAPEAERLCPSHGDFSPRNVLVTESGLALIDFDRIQMAAPGRDVEYLAAWCWVTATMAGRTDDAWALGNEFADRYLALRPESRHDLTRSRHFYRAVALVRIATEWTSMRSDPSASDLVLDEAERQAATGLRL
jgi:Phosphotransferase enzyme family